MECAAIQDALVAGNALDEKESPERKGELDRMALMLSRLGGRGYAVEEDAANDDITKTDFDSDFDDSNFQ